MLVWTLSILCFLIGARATFAAYAPAGGGFGRERASLQRIAALLQEIEETLAAGLIPAPARWEALRFLPEPWGALAHASLQELRQGGGALLPTLRRLRALALEHVASLTEARARAAQALVQALGCALMIPFFAGVLYLLLPGVNGRPFTWLAACVLALLAAGGGALWMMRIAENARWGGLEPRQRPWVLAAQCGFERFLALVRAGNPADLAWGKTCELLARETPELAGAWGHSVWTARAAVPTRGAALVLVQAGDAIRKAVQVSLMEGRPCTERVEAALLGLRQDLKAQVERELQLLATRALQPLFTCVAPALLGLLVFGLWLTWDQSIGPGGAG